ncbi:MAG: peptidylprolyl isomerase, partial [Planctomycetota bacterium]
NPTPTVQWQVNTGTGSSYSNLTDVGVYTGSSTGTLTITNATLAMSGYQYKAVFTNTAGTPATTTAATLTVQVAPSTPSVTTNPAPQTIVVGGTASFTAAASGNPTPTVQWQVNTGTGSSYGNLTDVGVYTGSNTGTLTITGTTLAMSGYQYKAVFTNAVGTPATTTAATLTVLANSFSVLAPPASVAIGSPVLIALNSVNSSTPTFSATTTSTNDPTGSKLTATHMPQTNQVLKIVTDQGEMDFQLFNNYTPSTVSHFVDLVNTNTYTNTSFYRIIQTFMIQGGSGGSGSTIPVELRGDLRFTSSGLLAMANNGVDGNSSEFFITSPNDTSNGFLDFRYTIFGKLIKGDNVRQAIAAKPVSTNSSGENSQPVTPLKILSMSITTDTQDGVLLLKALPEATGSYTVNVSDGLGGTQTFTINVGTNSFDPPNPWVTPINGTDKIFTAANTPATFTPQGVSADGSAAQVNVQLFRAVPVYPGDYVDNSYTGTSPAADAINPNMTLTQNGSSYTVTPTTGFYGVQVLEVTSQSATAAAWDAGSGVDPVYRAFVPVFVAPPAPQTDSISVNGQTVTGSTSANNSNSNTKLSFNVSGAISGATVSVYVDGIAAPIATGTVASGATSITLTTDGITTLPAGGRQFTVKQTIATSALSLFANFSTSTGSPGSQFQIPASSVASVASAGTALTIS